MASPVLAASIASWMTPKSPLPSGATARVAASTGLVKAKSLRDVPKSHHTPPCAPAPRALRPCERSAVRSAPGSPVGWERARARRRAKDFAPSGEPVLLLPLLWACAPRYHLALYETAPVETTLDHADLPEAHETWLARIEGARERIELGHFYASDQPGSRLEPIVAALEAAADRGVAVRFLADAKFSRTYPETLERLDAREGIELRLLDLETKTGGVLHAKYMLVDGMQVLLGSQNFDWRSLEHVQELGAAVDHPDVVAAFAQVFEADWALAAGAQAVAPQAALEAPVTVRFEGEKVQVLPVFSPQGLLPDADLWDLPRLVAMIDAAQRRVRVQLHSYKTHDYDGSTFNDLDLALRRASARGVQVELIVAHWSLRRSQVGDLKLLQQDPGITVKVATVPEHSQGFIPFARVVHAKYLVVDGEHAWVGTSNWGGDYFHKSRNVGLLLDGPAVAARLDAFFEDLWTSPYVETLDPNRDYPDPRYRE